MVGKKTGQGLNERLSSARFELPCLVSNDRDAAPASLSTAPS